MQTELWYTDEHTKDVRFSMKTIEQIASKRSAVQQIDILDTPAYGRVLVLDGGLMITEKDEFIYHEMLAHVPMAVHPNVRNVLVIGGGDGGTVRELTKYRSIESIDLVEVDKDVVLLSKKFLPFVSSKLKDKRVAVWFEEGLRYVRGKKDEYDLVIPPSTRRISRAILQGTGSSALRRRSTTPSAISTRRDGTSCESRRATTTPISTAARLRCRTTFSTS